MKRLTTVMAAGVISLASGSVFAANIDAALTTGAGATSTGNFDLNIVKGDAVSITGMQTINITGTNGPTAQTGSISVCTYATTTNYQLEINSLGAGGAASAASSAFDAEDAGSLMAYSVDWADGISTLTFADNGDAASIVPSPNLLDATCGGGTNTTITATVASVDFNAAPSGTYTDTLEVIITAQ